MKKILSARYTLFISAAFAAVFTVVMNNIDLIIAGPYGKGSLYLQLSFTKENFISVLNNWGPEGIAYFLDTIWLDFLYPPMYALLLSSGAANTVKKLNELSKTDEEISGLKLSIPFIAAGFDYTENLAEIYILKNNLFTDFNIAAASSISAIKWTLILVSVFNVVKEYLKLRRARIGR